MMAEQEGERRCRVLVIDDSELAAQVAEAALTKAGFDVRAVTTLDEFNIIMSRWVPELVVADVNMPQMSGPELCAWLKRQMENVPVIFFSNLEECDLREVAMLSGADGFVPKGDGLDALCAHLTNLREGMVW